MSERQAMNRPLSKHPIKGSLFSAAIALALGTLPLAATALPVIPNAAGFGIETPAGRGGKVYRVTNLNSTGAGSLSECIKASGPRVCVFEVSGTIRMTDDIVIRNPYITIAGQTAPSPGIMMRGGALRISTSHVLVQHLRVRPGDDPVGPTPTNRDALGIESPPERPITNIVVDHCSFGWSTDEVASLWNAWNNVTLSNNIFAEGLLDSPIPGASHGGYGLLVGPTDGRVSIIGNLLAHNRDRNPLTRGKQFVFVNNVVYNKKTTGVDLQSEGLVTDNTIVGNVFIPGADSREGYGPVTIRTTDWALPTSSKIYLSDNVAPEAVPGNDWSIVGAYSGTLSTALKNASLPPTWPAGLTRLSTDSNVVLESVLDSVGARPADRDPVDRRVVQSVRDRTGKIISCVAPNGTAACANNAGGWPTLAQNRRALTLPSDPNAVTSSGYTNLELWLHRMSAEVEGRANHPPVPPVLAGNK